MVDCDGLCVCNAFGGLEMSTSSAQAGPPHAYVWLSCYVYGFQLTVEGFVEEFK